MKVVFDVDKLEHIKEKSCYNHNYYKLPFSINNCSVLYIEWEDDSSFGDYYLGEFNEKGKFESKHCFYGDLVGNVDLLNNEI